MTPKLVVNAGLRWEPYFPYTDTLNRIPCYRTGLHSQRYPNAPTGLIYAGDPGCPRGGTGGDSFQLAPRLGFSYRMYPATVIRGGAGPNATFTLPVGISGTFPSRYYLPTVGAWNLIIEQQLGSNWRLSLGYFGNGGYHLSSNAIGRRPLNPAIYIPGQSTQANTQSRRINPNFSGVNLYPTDLNSRY